MIAIVAGLGTNLTSLRAALERLGARCVVTDEAVTLEQATRVILPGVGAAPVAMRELRARGLVDLLPKLTQPVLGICLGMQLMFERSAEGESIGLGVLPGCVARLAPPGLPVPHMGWNRVTTDANESLLAGLEPAPWFYFVHSYAAPVVEATVAVAEYGGTFSAIVRRANFTGVQFHPERSGATGARLLANWLAA